MSYRAGIGAGLASDNTSRDPRIVCDECGVERTVYKNKNSYAPAAWLLNGKKAPGGWSGGRREDLMRDDWCPACTESRKAAR